MIEMLLMDYFYLVFNERIRIIAEEWIFSVVAAWPAETKINKKLRLFQNYVEMKIEQ